MDIWPTTVDLAKWVISSDKDLTDATAEAYIGGAWLPLAWENASTETDGKFYRTASLLVRGEAGANGVIVLQDEAPQVRIVLGNLALSVESKLWFNVKG